MQKYDSINNNNTKIFVVIVSIKLKNKAIISNCQN